MKKPQPTVADYMVIVLSPALIIGLVGSLCFFLINVFSRGQMQGALCWVMFWFIIGIVLVSRIAIEQSTQQAVMYGLWLAAATWIYVVRMHPAFYFIGLVLLAIVWFCAHKLVWDCTLIDEDADSSGQGLLQPAVKKPDRKAGAPHAPGRWVIYFSLAALPLFGVGQMLLPVNAPEARRNGFIFLAVYLGAALGLLVTTSFLGLRRYLRQRYLKMPASIALAWVKFGAGVACIVLIGAIFLPRPGANAAWASLRYQMDYQLQRASQYAARFNPPGQGQGRAGNESGGKEGSAPKPAQDQANKPSSGQEKSDQAQNTPSPQPAPTLPSGAVGNIYYLLRAAVFIVGALLAGWWIFRRRHMFLEMIRSMIDAIRDFFRKLFEVGPARKAVGKSAPSPVIPKFSSFAEYKNPFYAGKDYAMEPEQVIVYTYEAVQVWAREQRIAARPEETAREFCARLGENRAALDSSLNYLARLYAHAAYATKLPPDSDLEPIRELWRRLKTPVEAAA